MNMHSPAAVWPLAASLALTSSLFSQEVTRTLLPQKGEGATAATAQHRPQGPSGTTAQLQGTAPDERELDSPTRSIPTDDAPNFAPMVSEPAEDDANPKVRLDGNPYRLSFTNGDFEPKRGIDPALVRDLAANPGGSVFGFVMLRGRITEAKVRAITELGVELLGPHTWQSFKAQIPGRSIGVLGELPFVHWVGYARPAQKLDKVLAGALTNATAGQEFDIWVNFFKSDLGPNTERVVVGKNRKLSERHDEGSATYIIPNGRFQKMLESLGFEFSFYSDSIFAMRGQATKAEILEDPRPELCRVHRVAARHRHRRPRSVAGDDRRRPRALGVSRPRRTLGLDRHGHRLVAVAQ